MKLSKIVAAQVLCLSLVPPVVHAETSLDSTTILRIEQRDAPNPGDRQSLVPVTQFLGLDVNKLGDGNLSLHLYGWGRADLADKSFNGERVDGSLTYGYLQYRSDKGSADARLGRVFVHEGIANEQLDGAAIRTDLPGGFALSAFGGATVHGRSLLGESSDGKGDSLFGGRGSYRYKGMLELGVSGVYEGNAPHLVNYTNGNHRLLGGDVWLSPNRYLSLAGHTSYNPETEGVAEHTYLLNIKPARSLTVTAEFNEHHERNYLYAWSMFSGAALNPADRSRSTGGSVSYELSKQVEVSADYKHYARDLGDADRYGGDLRLSTSDNTVRGGLSYHYLRADAGFSITNTLGASYHEGRAYAMHDSKSYFAALDVLGIVFRERIYNEKSIWETVGSLGYHLTQDLALSGDLSYGKNSEFSDELKGLLRLTYNVTLADGKGVKK